MEQQRKAKTPPLYEIPESIATTKESDTNISSKDSELLNNTLGRSPSLSQRIIEEIKRNILHSGFITARQSEDISDYIMRHLGDKKSNEILIEKRLYSKLEKALK